VNAPHLSREEWEREVDENIRTYGYGSLTQWLDRGFKVVSCGPDGCGYPHCRGWRISMDIERILSEYKTLRLHDGLPWTLPSRGDNG
jgi:hypothetical protein